MAFFVPKTDIASIQDGGNYITTSGIYDVTLKVVSVKVNNHNARSLDFNVEYQGSNQVFYGLKLDNNDGSENFERKVFNKLVIVCGLDSVSEPEIQEHKLGKDQTPTDLAVLTDFTDIPVKMRVQFEYSIYNNEIKEKKLIRSFYRSHDGATAAEILAGKGYGQQLAKDMEYANNVVYKDGLTAEDVAAWKEGKKLTKPSPKPTPNEFAGVAAGFPG